MINQEKTNEEVEPNEIQITLTGSPQLAGCGATYVKYYLVCEEGAKPLEGHIQCKDDTVTNKHRFNTANLAKMLHGLKDMKIDFTIKKKKFFGATNLET